jgi:excisionase family DNA binding protein
MNEVMTAEEVAKYLGLAVETIYRKARAGEIPAVRIGRRWRFFRETLEAWLRGEGAARPGEGRALDRTRIPDFLVWDGGEIKSSLRRVDLYDDD